METHGQNHLMTMKQHRGNNMLESCNAQMPTLACQVITERCEHERAFHPLLAIKQTLSSSTAASTSVGECASASVSYADTLCSHFVCTVTVF